MQESIKVDLNNDLENLEQKLLKIAFSDPEQYEFFSSRLKKVQSDLLGISEPELERNKVKIISDITTMIGDFDAYMEGNSHKPIDAFIPGKELESGYSKLRKYKINLYSTILDDLCKLDIINPIELKKLRAKWKEDSKDLEFSPFELSAMDEKFATSFLEYQIKYMQANNAFPKDTIAEYTSLEEYQDALQNRLVQVSKEQGVSPQTQLEIEILMNEPNLERLLNSQNLWRILTTKSISTSHKDVSKALDLTQIPEVSKPEAKNDEPQKEQTQNLPMVVPAKSQNSKYMICTIEKTNRLFNKGQKSYKQIKVRIKDGVAKLPQKYRDSIVEVYIPEGTTKIAREGFDKCQKLVNVHLPSTLEDIEMSAFRSCERLKSISFPKSLKTIGTYAFDGCTSLSEVNFSEGLRKIGERAFYYCRSLKNIKMPSTVYEVRDSAFSLCANLEEIEFSDLLRVIPMQCLSNCRKLKRIKFPQNLEKIDDYALENCKEIRDLSNLPNGLKYIGDYAMWGCDNLERFYFPEALEGTGRMPLLHSKKLREVIMGRHIKDGNALFKLGIRPETDIKIPEGANGGFYEDFRLTENSTVTMNDIIKQLTYVEGKRREDYLKEYYGLDAEKYL